MTQEEQIFFKIDKKTGNLTIEGKGFEGPICEDVLKSFEELGEITHDKRTPEYYKKPRQVQTTRQRLRH
ncbi:DUF2997 domain-containing protein [Candidatus Borrarchaeum sp.]|uniref:DUF2997 domain-containing protein n=1 Tax=Candidatus Borrarchaeum sp. TaxID=2846742 RepID=UPI00257B542E|nr:DUF2997 domain-containing protein [Candidatus Borrarchaeum sp.]